METILHSTSINPNTCLEMLQQFEEKYHMCDDEIAVLLKMDIETLKKACAENRAFISYKLIVIDYFDKTPIDIRISALITDVVSRGVDADDLSKLAGVNRNIVLAVLNNSAKVSIENKYRIYVYSIAARFFLDKIYTALEKNFILENNCNIIEQIRKNQNFLKDLDYSQISEFGGGSTFQEKIRFYFGALPNADQQICQYLWGYRADFGIPFSTMAKLCHLKELTLTDFLENPEKVNCNDKIKIAALSVILKTVLHLNNKQ